MLQELHIKNFTIIPQAEIAFAKGLNIITGETGAGKSIILDALSFVLGARFDTKIIRAQANECSVTAVFLLQMTPEVQELCDELGIALFDQQLYIKRSLNQEGRSRAYLNDNLVTLQKLKQLGLLLLQFYGQHEHQTLLKPEVQLGLLDRFGQHEPICELVAESYSGYQACCQELQALQNQAQHQQTQMELLNYQLAELEAANLLADELQALYQEQKQLSHAQELMEKSSMLLTRLKDAEPSLLGELKHVGRELGQLQEWSPSLSNAEQLIKEAYTLAEEASLDLKRFYEALVSDPEKLKHIETRIDVLHTLARKHQLKPEDLWPHYQTLKMNHSQHLNFDERLQTLIQQQEELENTYVAAAKNLSAARQKTSLRLAAEVTQYLQKLGLPHGKFTLQLSPRATMHKDGLELVQFLVQLNPGGREAPMADVASGGELSRIGLALAVLTAETASTPTLVFDEVDVGVSGAVAEMIGQLLADLGEKVQVICVTHLAQVAVYADQHLLVAKQQDHSSTTTTVTGLDFEGRAAALAQIVSGQEVTKEALKHAEDWLKKVSAVR